MAAAMSELHFAHCSANTTARCNTQRCGTLKIVASPIVWGGNRISTGAAIARLAVRMTRRVGASAPSSEAKGAVDELENILVGSDSGAEISAEQKLRVEELIAQLEVIGASQSPLDDPAIFGNYNVSYSAAGARQKGAPAGGRFRSGLGRILFRTTGIFQNILAPTLVVNKVAFRLFGFIPGFVALTGTFEAEGSSRAAVKVRFQQPLLQLGPCRFAIGPKSSVGLSTTYLDDRIRLGKGKMGSLFVFTRGGKADTAIADVPPQSLTHPVVVVMAAAAALAAAWGLRAAALVAGARMGPVAGAVTAAAAVGVLALALVLRNGGIIDEEAQDREDAAVAERRLAVEGAAAVR